MAGATVNQRVMKLAFTKSWTTADHWSTQLCVGALNTFVHYLKTVLLLSSGGESKLRTKFCTTWTPFSFWCKQHDKWLEQSVSCEIAVLILYVHCCMFLYHCLIFTSFSLPVVFAITIIIIVVVVRQTFPNNIYVQQNTLGLFITRPIN